MVALSHPSTDVGLVSFFFLWALVRRKFSRAGSLVLVAHLSTLSAGIRGIPLGGVGKRRGGVAATATWRCLDGDCWTSYSGRLGDWLFVGGVVCWAGFPGQEKGGDMKLLMCALAQTDFE